MDLDIVDLFDHTYTYPNNQGVEYPVYECSYSSVRVP